MVSRFSGATNDVSRIAYKTAWVMFLFVGCGVVFGMGDKGLIVF